MKRTGLFWLGAIIALVALWNMSDGPAAWAAVGLYCMVYGLKEL